MCDMCDWVKRKPTEDEADDYPNEGGVAWCLECLQCGDTDQITNKDIQNGYTLDGIPDDKRFVCGDEE